MVFTSTLTSKNQTTIPKAIIEALEAKPSATLCYEMEPDGRILLTAKSASFAELAGTFPKKTRHKAASIEDMQKAVRLAASRHGEQSKPGRP